MPSDHSTTQPAPRPFQLSQLLYDTRYRAMTIQIIVLFCVMALFTWLADNTVRNLQALGKDFNFNFLNVRAGYDINQRPIEYTNDSTHGRALLVGLLNTLLVAGAACVSATILGVIIGVLRLSRNWLVSKLMGFYVEIFRNVPLLLWIIVIFAVLTEAMPAPSAFRGEEATASMLLFDSIAITNRGIYMPSPAFSHSLGAVMLGPFDLSYNYAALLAVLIIALYFNRRMIHQARERQALTGEQTSLWWRTALIIILPLSVVLYALGFHWEYPELKGFNFTGGGYLRNSFTAMWVALSLYSASYVAENVRAGILAISKGQSEAALALGLRPKRVMSLVILPQALRVIIPPLISQYLNITKNSSLGIAVGYMDLRSTLGGISLNQTGRELEAMLLMMAIYLIISLVISGVMNLYNASIKLKER